MACKEYYQSRRRMLKGTLGFAGASLLGMPVRNLFSLSETARPATAKHVILFWNGGGMSHVDTWDPKPGTPVQGEFEPINTSADGIQISEIFPKVATQMHNAAIVRSIAGTNGDHGRATYELQTSHGQVPNIVHPGIGSVVVSELDRIGDLPAFVSIGGRAPRAGYLGQSCEAYYVGRPGEKDPYLAFPEGINKAQGNRRLDILAKMNARISAKTGSVDMKATETAVDDAVTLMRSPALKAFEMSDADNPSLERYGQTEFGRAALLSRKLVETGVRFVQVNRGGFDNHGNIFPAMRNHGATMDPAIGSLMEDLKASGKLDETLIVVLSEFGRTPRINNGAGRDHHARCFSALLAGGGISGGTVVGASDEHAMVPADRPVKPSDIHATVCQALGIDHNKEVTTPSGRPMRLIRRECEPISELFA